MPELYCDRINIANLVGRWVRSDSKYENWENYMRWFGMDEAKVREETIEPQNHIITAASKERITIVHQLPWRHGAQCEYTLEMDGQYHPIPEKLFGTARSSWKVNPEATWLHRFDERGLLAEQKIPAKGKSHMLRYWRTMLSVNEIQVSVHMSEILENGEEKEVAHTKRFFQRIPFKPRWTAAAAQFFSGMDVEENLRTCISWMRKARAKGADLVVLPENSNRDRAYFKDGKPSRDMCYDKAETLDGAFIAGLKAACQELGLWLAVGVDIRGAARPSVHIATLLIRPDGEIEGVVKKHVLWDYEYTLFEPGSEPYQVFDTELGRLGLLICADGIVPEASRVLSLMGAQVLLNSLNSRGPDEMRVHIPLRAIENGVWHVASNSVGNPNTVGLLWPWTGGSEICDPQGKRVAASEEHDDMVVGEVRPFEAELKKSSWTADLFAMRRPELYGILTKPLSEVPCAAMYGPAPAELPGEGPEVLKVAMMQFSRVHTRQCSEWMAKRQIAYAKRRGAALGVLPELFCLARGEAEKDPRGSAEYCASVLEQLLAAAKEQAIHLCCSLVEAAEGKIFHTAYLLGPEGVVARYRKAHLSDAERAWATPGDSLSSVVRTAALGAVALMVGNEVWIPEVARCLALQGAEVLLHPADWDCAEAGEMAATERASENRVHLVSVTRLDCPGRLGSQTTLAGEYIGGEPIPLMRYPQGVWCRHNVEEQVIVDLPRRQAHCKMMGDHLDVLHKRFPELYGVCTRPESELFTWRGTTKTRPGDYEDGLLPQRGAVGVKRKYDVEAPTEASVPIAES